MAVGSMLELDDCFLERFGSDFGSILGSWGSILGWFFEVGRGMETRSC